jgi:hypothetical protein
MQIRAVFVAAFLLSSSAAALAESRSTCQSVSRPHASSFDAAVLPATLQSEGSLAQAFARSLCRPSAPLCTSAINYSIRQQ